MTDANEVRLKLDGIFPHQRELLECPSRYALVVAGTKSGKSTAAGYWCAMQLANRPGSAGLWISPSYDQSTSIGLELVRKLLPAEYVSIRYSGVPTLSFANDSRLEFRSADQPATLFGHAYSWVVVDEAARINDEAWQAVRSTVTATGGPIRFLSNPGPRTSWFYAMYLRGLDDADPDVKSFRWPTRLNPTIGEAELEDARRTMTEAAYRSLYEGTFLDEESAIFRGVRAAATATPMDPVAGHRYRIGFDPARTVDFAVAVVVDLETRAMVHLGRWRGLSWEESVRRVADLAVRYNNAEVVSDSTGLGDPIQEQLERSGGFRVRGQKFSNSWKAVAVERVGALLEKGILRLIPDPVLLEEFESYVATTSPTGMTRYAAAGGGHDDICSAVLLAASEIPIEDPRPAYARAVPIFGGGASLYRNLPPVPAGMSRPLDFGRPHRRGF